MSKNNDKDKEIKRMENVITQLVKTLQEIRENNHIISKNYQSNAWVRQAGISQKEAVESLREIGKKLKREKL